MTAWLALFLATTALVTRLGTMGSALRFTYVEATRVWALDAQITIGRGAG